MSLLIIFWNDYGKTENDVFVLYTYSISSYGYLQMFRIAKKKYKQAKKTLFGPAFISETVLRVVTLHTAHFSGGFLCMHCRQVCY